MQQNHLAAGLCHAPAGATVLACIHCLDLRDSEGAQKGKAAGDGRVGREGKR